MTTTLIYVIPSDDLSTGLQTALDIYSASGIEPKVITDGITSLKFNAKDVASLSMQRMKKEDYTNRHRIE